MTPAEIITQVRNVISDTAVPLRYSDTVLLGFVNQTIKRMIAYRPDLFTIVADLVVTPNDVRQTLPAAAVRLVEVFRVKNGAAIEEVDKDQFDRAYPAWTTDPAGSPTKYMRHPRNPRVFFLYPRPLAATEIVVEYVVTPTDYDINDQISVLPDAFATTIIDGVIYLAEVIDNEHVDSERAKMFLDLFLGSLGASLQSRILTDTDTIGTVAPGSDGQ